jgi:hypothetical protein
MSEIVSEAEKKRKEDERIVLEFTAEEPAETEAEDPAQAV